MASAEHIVAVAAALRTVAPCGTVNAVDATARVVEPHPLAADVAVRLTLKPLATHPVPGLLQVTVMFLPAGTVCGRRQGTKKQQQQQQRYNL